MPAQLFESVGQVVVSIGKVRLAFNGLLVQGNGLLQPVLVAQDIGILLSTSAKSGRIVFARAYHSRARSNFSCAQKSVPIRLQISGLSGSSALARSKAASASSHRFSACRAEARLQSGRTCSAQWIEIDRLLQTIDCLHAFILQNQRAAEIVVSRRQVRLDVYDLTVTADGFVQLAIIL